MTATCLTVKANVGEDTLLETILWEWFRHYNSRHFIICTWGKIERAQQTVPEGSRRVKASNAQQRCLWFRWKTQYTRYEMPQSKLCLWSCWGQIMTMCWVFKMSCRFKYLRHKNSAWGPGHADYCGDADWLARVLASSMPFTKPASLTDNHNPILHHLFGVYKYWRDMGTLFERKCSPLSTV